MNAMEKENKSGKTVPAMKAYGRTIMYIYNKKFNERLMEKGFSTTRMAMSSKVNS